MTFAHMWITSRAIGQLVRSHRDPKRSDLPIRVHPLHPDGCGGLAIVGTMLSLVLYAAAISGGVGLGIFLILQKTPFVPTRRPELYLLGLFYVILLPSAFRNLLWCPHQLMDQCRDEILTPLATVFNHTRPSELDNTEQLKAKATALSEITRQLGLLDQALPVWPLRMRPLRTVLATAVLPVATAVVTKFLAG